MNALFIIFLIAIVVLGLIAAARGGLSLVAGNVEKKSNSFSHYFNCVLQRLNPVKGTPKLFLLWVGGGLFKIWKFIYVFPDLIFKNWWPDRNGKTLLRVKVCRNIFWVIVAIVGMYFVKLHINPFLDWLYMRFI